MKSYRVLQCARESYNNVKDPMGWVWKLREKDERTPQHSIKF